MHLPYRLHASKRAAGTGSRRRYSEPMTAGTNSTALTVRRRRRIGAAAIDAATALLALAAGLLVAAAWLLLRTDFGRTDVGEGDGVAAASLVGATMPAWAAWLALRVRRDGATVGQRRAGLTVVPRSQARGWPPQLRFAIHPLALPLWGWLALTALLSGVPWLWLLPVLMSAVIALAGVVSFALLLLWPQRRAIHDLVAGTTLVPALREEG